MLRDRLALSERRRVGMSASTARPSGASRSSPLMIRRCVRRCAWSLQIARGGAVAARITSCVVRAGWSIASDTRRLWREVGLRVPPRARKRSKTSDQPERAGCAPASPDEVGAIDFQHDMTADGRPLRLVNVIDEFAREALVLRVERSRLLPERRSARACPSAKVRLRVRHATVA